MGRYPVFIIRRLKTVKMTIPSKLIYRLNAIYIKILAAFFFFAETDKLNTKIHMEMQGTPNSPNHLKEEKQRWMTHMFLFQNNYKATVITVV